MIVVLMLNECHHYGKYDKIKDIDLLYENINI